LLGTVGHSTYSQYNLKRKLFSETPLNITHSQSAASCINNTLIRMERLIGELNGSKQIELELNRDEVNALLIELCSRRNVLTGCQIIPAGDHTEILVSIRDKQNGLYVNLEGTGHIEIKDGAIKLILSNGRFGDIKFGHGNFRNIEQWLERILNDNVRDFLVCVRKADVRGEAVRVILEKIENQTGNSIDMRLEE